LALASSKSSAAFDGRHFLAANFLAALTILLLDKALLVIYTVSGAEGQTSVLVTALRTVFLCLGWDFVGALLLTALVALLAYPVGRWVGRSWAMGIAAFLQAAHALFLWVSYNVTRNIGSPFDKPAIDLAFLNSDPTTTNAMSHQPIWPSVVPYFQGRNLVYLILVLVVSAGLPLLLFRAPRWPQRRARWGWRILGAVMVIDIVLTVVIMPAIRNGEYLGVRIHSLGLERSHFLNLVGSYLRDPMRAWATREPLPKDPFCLDMRSLESPRPAPPNPLMRAGSAGQEALVKPERTNLLFVLLESVGGRYTSGDTMPLLMGLSHHPGALSFAHHLTPWPMTIQSLFTIFCSELPHPDYPPITHVNPAIPCVSLSEALKDAGYATALFTSQDLAYDRQMRFFRHRRLDTIHDANDMPGRDAPGVKTNSWGIEEAVTRHALLDWIDRGRQQAPSTPFFAFYQFGGTGTHFPYECSGKAATEDMSDEQLFKAYRGCLGYVDQQLQLLLDGLRDRHILDKTLVVVVSDHGEGFSQHYGRHGRLHGTLVYDEFLHVPMVITGPQLARISGTFLMPTSHADLAPTLLGLLDIPVPLTMKGRDLTRQGGPRVLIAGSRPPVMQFSATDWPTKLVLSQETGVIELFDLENDPNETRNLADERKDKIPPLLAKIHAWQGHSRNLIENYAAILKNNGHGCDAPAAEPQGGSARP
jgi:phosphoglycerol transferase MdoB-like AlkP superfamily enzyme